MSNSYSKESSGAVPLHLCFFLMILFSFVGITWYINYDSILEGILDQIKLLLMVSPLLLLLALHLLSNSSFFFFRQESIPWGLGLLLVLLLFMVSYHSDLRDRWFPLLA